MNKNNIIVICHLVKPCRHLLTDYGRAANKRTAHIWPALHPVTSFSWPNNPRKCVMKTFIVPVQQCYRRTTNALSKHVGFFSDVIVRKNDHRGFPHVRLLCNKLSITQHFKCLAHTITKTKLALLWVIFFTLLFLLLNKLFKCGIHEQPKMCEITCISLSRTYRSCRSYWMHVIMVSGMSKCMCNLHLYSNTFPV